MTMFATLAGWRDRAGHGAWCTALALAVLFAAPTPSAADGPGNYVARRFDVTAQVLAGGSLDVTESITFEFQSGTFKKVWREIAASRTDCIELVDARMDGTSFSRGEGPGHIAVSGRNGVKVEWQFTPTGPSTHTFELRYLARGVVYREQGSDVVRWRLLPSQHKYKIDSSTSTIAAAVAAAGAPAIESRRVREVLNDRSARGITITANGIGENGWVVAEIRYPEGRLITAVPAWQDRHAGAEALAPRWSMAAGGIFVAAVIVLLFLRQGYDSPGFETGKVTSTEPPEALPAAIAAALAAKGRSSGFQSIATILDLADRGALAIRELPRKLGARQYELVQIPGKHDLEDHEMEALSIAFAGTGDPVTLSKARARLARRATRFSTALNGDLAERGLTDPARSFIRARLILVSIVMLVTAGVGTIAVAPTIPRYEGWPFLLPLGLALAGLVGLVIAASTTPLSDAGLVQGARWTGFKRHLKELANARDDRGAAGIRSRWIVYGIALGLAHQWSRYLKAHPDAAPSWFVAGADEQPGTAFAAFVGSGAASTSGHGSGGGGGAAGGGASGAG